MSRLEARRRRFGHLDTLYVEGSGTPSESPTVILLHGYGADASDLASLAGVLQVPKGTNWIFPNGHLSIPLGGHYAGRGWFPVSIAELEKSASGGGPVTMGDLIPPGMKKARGLVMGLLEQVEKAGTPMKNVLLGGFSQGGMVAVDVTLQLSKTPGRVPRGLAVLSGTLVNQTEWESLAPNLNGFEYFLSHGLRDGVLAFAMAEKLNALFKRAGWRGDLLAFGGAHEIPPEVIIQLGSYIRKRFSAAST